MITKSKKKKAREIVARHQYGDKLGTASEQRKKDYAARYGLNYTNGVFCKMQPDGNYEVVDVTNSDIMGDVTGNFMTDNVGNIGNVLDVAGGMLFTPNERVGNQSGLTKGLNQGYDTAADIVAKVNPMAGTIMKAGGFASDALTAAGVGTDQMTVGDKLLDSKFGKLTATGLVNAIGAQESDDFEIDYGMLEKVGGSYTGMASDLMEARDKAGKKYGLFSSGARRKANEIIALANDRQRKMRGIAGDARAQAESVAAMSDIMADAYATRMTGGVDLRYLKRAQGGVLEHGWKPSLRPETAGADDGWEPELLPVVERIVPGKFADGGVFDEIIDPVLGKIVPKIMDMAGGDGSVSVVVEASSPEMAAEAVDMLAGDSDDDRPRNLIPEGALHKDRHHMDNADELTKKGIPVVDGNHEQQAEIERNEIIFTKEVTDKLETWYHSYYEEGVTGEDKAALELQAGELLVNEILFNTDDRTGLIDTLRRGGVLPVV